MIESALIPLLIRVCTVSPLADALKGRSGYNSRIAAFSRFHTTATQREGKFSEAISLSIERNSECLHCILELFFLDFH